MTQEERVKKILEALDEHYSVQKKCWLDYKNAWQLLIATILSAQCTDARVNMVTKDLFRKYPDLYAFASADLEELEKDIHSTGFYHSKARNIIAASKILVQQYNAQIPSDIEELTKLPGVGRKTANVIRGNIYDIPSIVVDSHVGRISRKLGLTQNLDPEKVEHDLEKVLPEDHWILWNIQIIAHGRSICTARKPDCKACFLKEYCPSFKEQK
mgnify:CR=1 FL=1